jgi:subtilisin family serine protease
VPLPRRFPAAAVGVLVLAATLSTTGAASAEPAAQPRAACTQSGTPLRYLVLFDTGTAQQTAATQVAAACGTVTGYYPQIAVGIATSPDPDFAERMGTDRAFSAQLATRGDQTKAQRKPDETAAVDKKVSTTPAKMSTVDRTAEQWDMTMIGADRARKVDPGSRDVVVGVLDSGVDPTHPDLRTALDPALSAGCLTGNPVAATDSWIPTASPHGTHVAGTIAAADDGHGTAGVAPGVRIASVKVVDDNGLILPEYAVCGLMWAATKGMTITNNSYFVDPWLMTCDRDEEHVVYESMRRAVDYATKQGVLTVAAATNESADLANPSGQTESPATTGSSDGAEQERRTLDGSCRVLPAGLRGVVTVSATSEDELKASYSSYGLGVIDVAAPGGEEERSKDAQGADTGCVLSTVPGGYDRFCGTSMAAPHVSGVAALLASENPTATPEQLSKLLTTEADPVDCPTDYDLDGTGAQDAYCSGYAPFNGFYGHGMVDALAAVTP